MATEKNKKNKPIVRQEQNTELLWRKPITLDVEENEDDPLATLYRGRDVVSQKSEVTQDIKADISESIDRKSKSFEKPEAAKNIAEQIDTAKVETTAKPKIDYQEIPSGQTTDGKITETELKSILKIKSETFDFTDVREILRGKSLDIYALLRRLCGNKGVCKIKHLDLMKQLDISRPTLFKQGEWLTRLSLIEKRNVPGDHFGTSYTVRRLEEVLPVSKTLVEQLESYIENLGQAVD